jgi:hypothetical protein
MRCPNIKKYKLPQANLIDDLEKDPIQGKPLGQKCFKIRMANIYIANYNE